MTNYRGIDYSGGSGANRDPDTGIRYGVISQNSIMAEALEDVYYGRHSKDTAFEAWKEEVGSAVKRALTDLMGTRGAEFFAEEVLNGDIGDFYEGDEIDPLYEDGLYRITKCLNFDLMVLKSPYFTYAQYCSPCCPGACNLDSPLDHIPEDGSNGCFCLHHDWFDNGIAPYPVFDMAGNEVLAEEQG